MWNGSEGTAPRGFAAADAGDELWIYAVCSPDDRNPMLEVPVGLHKWKSGCRVYPNIRAWRAMGMGFERVTEE